MEEIKYGTIIDMIKKPKRIFSEEWRKNLSDSHKGKVSPRKGRKFVDEKISKQKRLAYLKVWKEKNKEKLLIQAREWQKKNRKKLSDSAVLRYKKNPQKILDQIRFRKYGISGDEFREMLRKQNNKCKVCDKSIGKNLSVDHNHTTGKIRGIICNNCNLAIGNAYESQIILRKLADYLDYHERT